MPIEGSLGRVDGRPAGSSRSLFVRYAALDEEVHVLDLGGGAGARVLVQSLGCLLLGESPGAHAAVSLIGTERMSS
jgi:hypothetical protein